MNQVNKSFFSLKSKIGGNQNYFKKKKKRGKNKEPRRFLFFNRVSMRVVISLFLVSSRKNHLKLELVEKNIHRKPLFEINYTMFLSIQTNNYASLNIGIRWSKRGSISKHPFFLENFEQANLSVSSCKIVEAQNLSRLIVKIFWT